jgi:hypothetical protein
MTLRAVFILLALGATLCSLVRGVAPIVTNGEVLHASGGQWMFRCVGFQAAAAALAVAAPAMD